MGVSWMLVEFISGMGTDSCFHLELGWLNPFDPTRETSQNLGPVRVNIM